jgi:hypothetical protein
MTDKNLNLERIALPFGNGSLDRTPEIDYDTVDEELNEDDLFNLQAHAVQQGEGFVETGSEESNKKNGAEWPDKPTK